jgi:sorbitol-specific phosphotransferase system component IIBC
MTGKAKVRLGDGKAVGKAEAERDDEAMDYLLKPSPPFVAGLTLGIAIATATAVAKLTTKQFWAIPLAGKVVAPCLVMAMPLFLFLCEEVANAHARANAKNRQRGR